MVEVLDFIDANTLPDYLFGGNVGPDHSDMQVVQASRPAGKSRFNRPNEMTMSGHSLENLTDFAIHIQCDAEQAVELLNHLYERYVPDNLDGRTLRDKAYALWGLEPQMRPDLDQVNEEYSRSLFQAYQVYQQLLLNNMIGSRDNETLQNQRKIARIFEVLYLVRDLIMSEQRWVAMCDPNLEVRIPDEVQIFKFSPFDYSTNTPFQNLIIYLLQQAYMKGYRRLNDDCYEQIRSPTGAYTHAWKRVCSILEFIHRVVQKETNYNMWQALTAAANTDKRAAEYLARHNDVEFPVLELNRHIYSFRNGILCLGGIEEKAGVTECRLPEFFAYDKHPMADSVVACKYFDLDFLSEEYHAADHWTQIPTPSFDLILTSQDLPEEAIKMMYVMVGRMCYNVNECDRWQVMPFIVGMANTGKSTILHQVYQFFNPENVGIMSSNMEHKFWASALYDKFAFLCYEARSDFSVPQGEMQSAISGEEMTVPIKHKVAVSLQWKVPGFMAGNQIPDWVDASSSMSRRIVAFFFQKKVKNSDPGLYAKLFQEMPALLFKANLAYLVAVSTHGSKSIAKWWGPYFDETSRKLAAQIRPVKTFLESSPGGKDLYVMQDTYFMPLREFQVDFQNFMQDSGAKRQTWNEALYGTVFADEGLQIQQGIRDYRGEKMRTTFIIGIGPQRYWEPTEEQKKTSEPGKDFYVPPVLSSPGKQ